MNSNKFLLPWIVSFILFIIWIMGCGNQEGKEKRIEDQQSSVGQITSGGIYRAPLLNNPATLDPAYVQDEYGTAVVQQIFDGLVRFNPYLLILPALAETWQVEDGGKKYRFILRDTARFHNGKRVTAEDVVFSISRLLRVEPSPAILPHLLKIAGAEVYRDLKAETVEGLQVLDDRRVVVQLKEPHAPFLTALGMYQAKILPKNEVTKLKDDFGRNPVGSGPFQFTAWEPDRRIHLNRFADYFAEAAFLDGIEFKIYPGLDIDRILVDFSKGELEEMPVVGNIRQELSGMEGLQWFHRPSLSLMFYGIRVNQPFLENADFRKALSMAIDRKKLIDQVYKGQFEPARTVLPPGMPGFSRENIVLTDDLASAQENLKKALEGKEHTAPSIEIVSNSKSAFAQTELSFIRASWAKLGITLKIKYITDWSKFETYINSESVQIYRYAWFADMPDPNSFLYSLFASESPVNYMGFKDDKVDQMLLAARAELDPIQRSKMYREIEEIVMNSSPLIPLLYLNVDRVYRPNVQGVQPSALGAAYMPLRGVWIEKDVSSN